jgi:xanthine/CO dehydrogenase XdhC/CoxF family maturation factor
MDDPNSLRHPDAANALSGAVAARQSPPAGRRFYEVLLDQITRRQPIAVATVVAVYGSASARPGSKAIISRDGRNLVGWVGGGCAESFVIQHAQEAIRDGLPRVIGVDLNDEAFGVGMPCGGSMEVYVEPMIPSRRLLILGNDATARFLAEWACLIGLSVVTESGRIKPAAADYMVIRPDATVDARWVEENPGFITSGLRILARTAAEEAVSLTAKLLMLETSGSGQPMDRPTGTPPANSTPGRQAAGPPHLILVGHNRITESLAALATSLDWTVTVNSPNASADAYATSVCRVLDDDAYAMDEVGPGSLVVIATQHKGDHLVLRSILAREPAYVGLIASRKRAALLIDSFKTDPAFQVLRERIHAPCGLDLAARSPFEIALAICCELIGEFHRTK